MLAQYQHLRLEVLARRKEISANAHRIEHLEYILIGNKSESTAALNVRIRCVDEMG